MKGGVIYGYEIFSNRTFISHEAECDLKKGLYYYAKWLCRFYATELQGIDEWEVSINGVIVCHTLDIDTIARKLANS